MAEQVVIVGAGLAGLAAAAVLARPRLSRHHLRRRAAALGGRASSFTDAASGQLARRLPARQHGLLHQLRPLLPHRRHRPLLQTAALPLFHDARPPRQPVRGRPPARAVPPGPQLSSAPITSARRKKPASPGACALACSATTADDDPPFLDWLPAIGQTPRTIDRFWGLVLTSALNETARPHRLALRPQGVRRRLPAPPPRLRGRAADRAARPALRRRTASWLDAARRPLAPGPGGPTASHVRDDARRRRLELRDGDARRGRLVRRRRAVRPPARSAAAGRGRRPTRTSRNLRHLETSPITSVHLWYDRPVTASAARRPGRLRRPVGVQPRRGRARRTLCAGGRQRRPAVPRPGPRRGAAAHRRGDRPSCFPRRRRRRCCARAW